MTAAIGNRCRRRDHIRGEIVFCSRHGHSNALYGNTILICDMPTKRDLLRPRDRQSSEIAIT